MARKTFQSDVKTLRYRRHPSAHADDRVTLRQELP